MGNVFKCAQNMKIVDRIHRKANSKFKGLLPFSYHEIKSPAKEPELADITSVR
jgi:hypothetical protein